MHIKINLIIIQMKLIGCNWSDEEFKEKIIEALENNKPISYEEDIELNPNIMI